MKRDKIPSVSATVDPEFLDNFHLLLTDQTGNNTLKFYCPQIDANAFNYDNLILTLSDAAAHYCLSRRTWEEYKNKPMQLSRLVREKFRRLRTNDGELGELMLFSFLEADLNAPKIATKMELKTNPNMYFNGADGVHYIKLSNGNYQLIFGESKVYSDLMAGISAAISSIHSFKTDTIKDEKTEETRGITFERGLINAHIAQETFSEEDKAFIKSLGNFPGYTLLEHDTNSDIEESLDLSIEKEFKQIINRDEYSNKVFTDSQHAVFQALLDRNHFSFSGPTSFGKSFILTSFIKSILINNKRGTNIVFLVPTRALVSQTLKKFKDILSDMEDYAISASPDIPALLRNQNKHYIFIFTPERFLHYLSTPSNPSIEYVFVDEAQKIVSEDTRSVIYYHAISLAERNSCKLFFASPNIENTDIFLKLFNKSTKETMVITEAPVCQMRLFIDLISHTATIFSDSANSETVCIDNRLDLYSMIDSISKKVDPLRYKSLIYCNTIDDTIRCAKEMADTLNEIESPELKKASDEIAAFIHKDYYLVSLIRKGVGFHFGKLPQKVRDIVELLYEKGDLHYLFCTSTLLEGVNLPAQNMFILNNQVGNRDFRAIDFWNLAGRAGRLAQELCGNVICVRWSIKNGRWTTDSSLDIIRRKKVEQIETDIISGKHNFYQNLLNATKDAPFTRRDTPDEQQRIYKSYSNVLLSHFADESMVENYLVDVDD